jgi:AcrR family transcriptional regulator
MGMQSRMDLMEESAMGRSLEYAQVVPPPGTVHAPTAAVTGRRRGKALERAIFEATLDQLTSGGFARLTMEGVAAAAQTGKAALYRRWTSKQELVLDALRATLAPASDIPDRGSVRAELLELMQRMCEAVQSPAGCAMRVIMGEMDHERAKEFAAFAVTRVIEPAKQSVLEVLRRGERRGDVRSGAATSLVADVAPALLLYRAKVCGGTPLPEEFARQMVDEVLLPLVLRPAAGGDRPRA